MQFGCIRAPRQTAQNGSANDDVSRYLSISVCIFIRSLPKLVVVVRALVSCAARDKCPLSHRRPHCYNHPGDGGHFVPARSCCPGLSHFPLFRGFCVALCLFHPLRRPLTFSICFVSPLFFGDALFPRALRPHIHILHRKFEAKQYQQTQDLTLK